MSMEIVKLLLSSAVTAAFLSYIFNRKLEKYKTFSKVNEEYISAVLKGLNFFLKDLKIMIEITKKHRDEIKSEEISDETIHELISAIRSYVATVQTHRIYLVPIIPIGGSEENGGLSECGLIVNSLQLFRREKEAGALTKEKKDKILRICLEAVDKLEQEYKSLGEKLNEVIKRIHSGKSILLT